MLVVDEREEVVETWRWLQRQCNEERREEVSSRPRRRDEKKRSAAEGQACGRAEMRKEGQVLWLGEKEGNQR